MEKLPTDIILDILSRLPQETMMNCKLVSKPWKDITSNIKLGLLFRFGWSPAAFCFAGEEYDDIDVNGIYSYKTLVEIENHRSTQEEPPLSYMLGSCNGLVCFSVMSEVAAVIYICNPITKEYVYLPTLNYDGNGMMEAVCFHLGFGYNHSTDEYKVVRIRINYINNPNDEASQVQVYTLGSGHGWRDIGTTDHSLSYDGVCANGAIHWVDLQKKKIAAFDLAYEKFRLIPFPPVFNTGNSCKISLKLFGAHLCAIHTDRGEVEDVIHIWALEKKKKFNMYDMEVHEFDEFWRWSNKFSIPCIKLMRFSPIAVTKSNQVLLRSVDKGVFCYDSETIEFRKLWDDGPGMITQASPHMNSIISLKALGEKSKRRK